MRVVHTGALAVWFGGGLLYLLSRPILRPALSSDVRAAHSSLMLSLTRRCFALLLASGAYLVFDRLDDPRVGALYIVVLGVKLALVAAIAWVTAIGPARGGTKLPGLANTACLVLALGAGALILGVALTAIHEADVAGAGVGP